MLSFPGHYRSWVFDTVEPVCEVRIDVYHLGGRMGWKFVLKLAESTKHGSMTGLLVNRYSDGFFAASRAGEDCGEFLFDDSNYSASSSPQPNRLSSSKRVGVNIYLWSRPQPPLRGTRLNRRNSLPCTSREGKYSERLLWANFRQSGW